MTGKSWMTPVGCSYLLTLMAAAAAVAAAAADSDDADLATFSESSCIVKHSQIVLALTCTTGQMVRLLRVFLGNMKLGTCEYSSGDCTMDFPNTENYACIGTESCRISMPSSTFIRQIPKCNEDSTYIQAQYQCIPGSKSMSICDRRRSIVVAQRGFVHTPGYPSNYPDNMDCNFTLMAPYDDQRLKLFVIDLNLEPKGTACSDWLQVFDGFQSNTLCGQRTRYWLRNSTQKTIHIHFHSDASTQEKGFWLYFEAFPFRAIPPTTTTSSSTSTLSTSTNFLQRPLKPKSSRNTPFLPTDALVSSSTSSFSSPTPSSSSSSSNSSSAAVSSNQVIYMTSDVPSLPLGILMAVVITLLICILLILLIIVFVRSRSAGRHLSIGSQFPGSNERMDNLEREQRAFCPSPHGAFFRDSAAGERLAVTQKDALLSSYLPSRMKEVL